MSSEGAVSHWIERLQAGDQAAAQQLWECYFRRLVGLLQGRQQRLERHPAAGTPTCDLLNNGVHSLFPAGLEEAMP